MNIEFENWGPFKGKHEFEFPKGILVVTGKNRDKEGADSNRVGKTYFINTLGYPLYGQNPLPVKNQSLITEGEKSSYAKIILNKKFYVQRFINHPEKKNEININGSPVNQNELDKELGIGFDPFVSSAFFGTGYSNFLDKVVRRPVEAKEVLTSLIPKLRIFDHASLWIKEQLDLITEEIAKFEKQILVIETQIDEILNSDYERKISQWQIDHHGSIERIQQEINTYYNNFDVNIFSFNLKKRTMKQLNKQLDAMEKIKEEHNSEIEKIEKEIRDNRETWLSYSDNLKSTKNDLDESNEHLSSVEDKVCPYCHQHIEKTAKLIEKEKSNIILYNSKIHRLVKRKSELENKNIELTKKCRDSKTIYEDYSYKIDALKDFIKIKEKENFLEEAKFQENPYIKDKEKSNERLESLRNKKANLEKMMDVLVKNEDHYMFWYRTGFGSRGIKAFALDDNIFKLTEYAKKYIDYLTDGTDSMSFDPRKKKKTGGFIENIGLELLHNGVEREFYAWSKSERKRLSLATDLGLNELLSEMFHNPFPFIVFDDETFDGLDKTGTQKFVSLLEEEEKLNKDKTIIIVTNREEDFPGQNIVYVVKKNGISSIKEAK